MTNEEIAKRIEKVQRRIDKATEELKELRSQCQHDWAVLDRGNDHDGYSMVDITWWETHKCKNCGLWEMIETGKSKAY